MKPPRCRQVEQGRIAADLEHNASEHRQSGGLFGDPQPVDESVDMRNEQPVGIEAAESLDSGGMRKAEFGMGLTDADPKERPQLALRKGCGSRSQRHRKPGHRPAVASGSAMKLGETGGRHAAAQRPVEACRAGGQHIGRPYLRVVHRRPPGRPLQRLRQGPFDLRDFLAQGANGRPRHGLPCHDGSLLDCSCYVLIDSRPLPQSQAFLSRIYS